MTENTQPPAQDDQELRIDVKAETLNLGRETMKGDLRDHMLEIYKHRPKSWQEMTEAQQRDMVNQIEDLVGHAIDKVVRIIASDGRPVSLVKIKQFTRKDGIQVQLEMSSHDKRRLEVMDSVGLDALLIVTKNENYHGETSPAQIDPDQPDIVDAAAAAADAAAGDGEPSEAELAGDDADDGDEE